MPHTPFTLMITVALNTTMHLKCHKRKLNELNSVGMKWMAGKKFFMNILWFLLGILVGLNNMLQFVLHSLEYKHTQGRRGECKGGRSAGDLGRFQEALLRGALKKSCCDFAGTGRRGAVGPDTRSFHGAQNPWQHPGPHSTPNKFRGTRAVVLRHRKEEASLRMHL